MFKFSTIKNYFRRFNIIGIIMKSYMCRIACKNHRASFNATCEKRLSFIAFTRSPLLAIKKPLLTSIFIILFIFGLSSNSFQDELIVDFEEESVPVINEEFRGIRKSILWKEKGGDTELETADDIDVQQMQMKQMRIENRTSDPASPATGEIWFRTDL